MRRLQFPIQLAYAMTFNRAQGQSVQKCGLWLENNVFTHDWLYVGLSQCGDPSRNVAIFVPVDEFITNHKVNPEEICARNIVDKEALYNIIWYLI